MENMIRKGLGVVADVVHYVLLRPIYGEAYPAAKIRWQGGKDFRRDGVV